MKQKINFIATITFTHLVTYYIAGIIAQLFLGANKFYPPSEEAIVYLKDPHLKSLQLMIVPAQLIRGLLFGLVLLPLLPQILKLGKWKGAFLIGSIILIIGFVAASGGLIEHIVYFKPEHYPVRFAALTFIEVGIQTILLSLAITFFISRYAKEK